MKTNLSSKQYISLTQTLLDCCHDKKVFHNTLLQNLPEDVDKRKQVLIQLHMSIRISKTELLHVGIKKGDLLSAVLKCKNVIANIFKKGLAAAKKTKTTKTEYQLIESIRKYYKNTSSAFQKYATTGARIVLFVPQVVFLTYLSVIGLWMGGMGYYTLYSGQNTYKNTPLRRKLFFYPRIGMLLLLSQISIVSIIKFIRNIFNIHKLQASQTKQTQKRLSTLLHDTQKQKKHVSKAKTSQKQVNVTQPNQHTAKQAKGASIA